MVAVFLSDSVVSFIKPIASCGDAFERLKNLAAKPQRILT
jgi:hypothetical protein